MKGDLLYLQHMYEAVSACIEYTSGGREAFFSQKLIQDAVFRNLEVLGEAVKNISPELRDAHPEIPWKKIAGLRDILIHQYFGIDLEAIWNVVEIRLPVFKAQIELLLNS